MITAFKEIAFKIDIKTNMEIHFLAITSNFQNGVHQSLKKSNDNPHYIHTSYNHLTAIIKQKSQYQKHIS